MTPELQAALTSLLSRKFLIAVFALLLVTFAIPVDPAKKVEFVTYIVGIFTSANVIQKALNPSKTVVEEKSTVADGAVTTEKKIEAPTTEKSPNG